MVTNRTWVAVLVVGVVCAAACERNQRPVPPLPPGTVPGSETRGFAERVARDGGRVSFVKRTPAPMWAAQSTACATYEIDGERVDIVEYAHRDLAEAAARQIDPSGSPIGSTHVDWAGRPHFFQRGALLALYVGSDDRALARLSKALGPQIAGR